MSSVQHLREFISARLTAAAEEIFKEFIKTIEEELQRQSRQLDHSWNPQLKLHRVDIQQLRLCKEEVQHINSSLDQEEPELPEIIEDWEEPEPFVIKQELEELVLKKETDNSMETFTCPDPDHLESEPDSPSAESQEGNDSLDTSPSVFRTQLVLFKVGMGLCPSPAVSEPEAEPESATDSSPAVLHKAKTVKCDICEKMFSCAYSLKRHHMVHSGERPYACRLCGNCFTQSYHLKVHMRSHTGEKPYVCKTCGKRYQYKVTLHHHMITHTSKSPSHPSLRRTHKEPVSTIS